MIKSGWRTSEFWTTLAALVGAVLTVAGVPADVSSTVKTAVVAAGGLVVAVYAAGRSALKHRALALPVTVTVAAPPAPAAAPAAAAPAPAAGTTPGVAS